MTIRNKPRPAAVFGIDIGKNLFHVVGLDPTGAPIQKVTFRRETLLQFFERASPTLVGMEACPGSQWLARKISALGHTVRIIPAQFVKPYVKSNKSDIIDAAAIAEAATRPTMRFVEIKTTEQVDLQALHRIRDRMIAHRTRLINQMRAFCLEYGIASHQGAGKFKVDLPKILADEGNDLTPAMRRILAMSFDELAELEGRIDGLNREIEGIAARSDTARRLMSIPGIGPLGATALLASAGSAKQFKRRGIWQLGWAWCPENIRPAARPHCLASASAETNICVACSFTAHDPASIISIGPEIAWAIGSMAFSLVCTKTKSPWLWPPRSPVSPG